MTTTPRSGGRFASSPVSNSCPNEVIAAYGVGEGDPLRHAIALRGSRALTTKNDRRFGLFTLTVDPEDSDDTGGATITRVPARVASAASARPRGG
jgi:hypothetical protein